MKQSSKYSRKVISIVLSLLMVFSCFSGMGLTAYADNTETLLTTITATGKEQANYSTANVATVSFSYTAGGSSAYYANWGWWGYGWSATVNAAEGYTITKCVFYDDEDRTATDSSSPFVVETTEEDKTPRINGTPIDGGNYQSKGIKKIEVYGYATPTHTHSFTYSSSNGTMTATCNGAGTCILTDNKVSFTLTAPTNLVYDGTDKKATLEGVDAFNAATGLNVSADDIVYNDLTNVVTETKNAGTYQALYTLQTDFPRPFVGITFTVAKANPTYEAPEGIYATYGQTLADVTLTNPSGNTAGTWAWVDDTTSVGDVGKKTFKANFTPADTTNYNTVENVDVTVKVNPADITPTVSIDNWKYGETAKTPVVSGNTGNGAVSYTYATKGSDSFSATVPTNAGNYTVKATIAATANYNGATATADFTIAKADPTYTVPTGLYATYGDTLADVTLPTGWAWADNTASVGNAGTNTFKANFTPADTANYNVVENVDVTIKVSKADPTYEAPTGLYADYGDTLADVALPEGWAWVDDTTSVGDVGKKTFKANFTPADTTNYNVVENVDVTVKVNPADITPTVTLDGWTYGNEANTPSVTGNAGNGDVAYTYAKKGSDEFGSDVPAEAGDYTVKAVIAETANYNGGEAEADFTIAKAEQEITAENVTATLGDTGKSVSASTDGEGAISYAVKEDSEDYIDVDSETGALTIKKAGTATVIVTAEETDNYASATKEVTVTINEPAPVSTKNGWVKSGGKWYYYKQDVMLKWYRTIDGKKYYFNSKGEMVTGWVKFNATQKWHYFKADGSEATGWFKDGADWYYANAQGEMQNNMWIKSGGKWYYLTNSGKMAVNMSILYKGKYYKFDKNGVCLNP